MVLKVDIKAFNLLEVVGAMLIIAFGITAVMGILQPSIRASRDSVGENYCADVATQILSLMETKARQKWSTVVGTSAALTTSCPPTSPTNIADSNIDTPDSWGGQISGTNIYTTGGSLSSLNASVVDEIPDKGVFGVKNGYDFNGHVKVWKKQISDFAYAGAVSSIPCDKAVRVNIEISFPATKPYSVREKRYYSLEVFNQ